MADPAPEAVLADIRRTLKKLENLDHYQRLDVEREADAKAIRAAYMTLAGKWHPDRFKKFDLGRDKPLLQRLFALLSESHSVLTTTNKRDEYDASLNLGKGNDVESVLNADNAFRLGQQLLERGQTRGAHLKFEQVLEVSPDHPRCQAYHAYTTYALLPRDENGKTVGGVKIKALKDTINAGIEESETFDDAYVFLGLIAADQGDKKQAKRHFNTALSLNKKNFQAQRQLRLLSMRNDSDGSLMDKLKAFFTKAR